MKPANVLRSGNDGPDGGGGVLKIMDFGFAHTLETSRLTRPVVFDTPVGRPNRPERSADRPCEPSRRLAVFRCLVWAEELVLEGHWCRKLHSNGDGTALS